ncbi:DgyrCDS3446 [Dimorphilus gyrociliatus]|uniref:DgyrCDS3446 n=1 Tax=Dimorphilus gyrociliatus TaxID=2664684 RepID=A0A7I8VDS6_9ANNE|nr:DgyrCDS3446 [Dimorphilus gyrociliatus]
MLQSEEEVKEFLKYYNYLKEKNTNSPDVHDIILSEHDSYQEALKLFQRRFNLRETGNLNPETLEAINSPRCGFPDYKDTPLSSKKPNSFTLNDEKWNQPKLSYKVVKYSNKIDKTLIDYNLDKAFQMWGERISLVFEHCKDCDKIDIEIKFVNRSHGDQNPFDGPGKVLAHAFSPENGDVHFDDEEEWTFTGIEGVNFFQAALHEIGHSLGLLHSENNAAVMAPKYSGYIKDYTLHDDDIKGIQALYPRDSKPGDLDPNICDENFLISATTSTHDGHRFFFSGKWVVIIFNNASIKIEKIKYIFKGFEGDRVDAAVYFNEKQYPYNQRTRLMVLFSKNKVHKFERDLGFDFYEASNYPKKTSQDFSIVTNRAGVEEFDAVMAINKTLLFFRDSYFWEVSDEQVSGRKHIKDVWKGVPYPISSALNYEYKGNYYFYFFKKHSYVRFNTKTGSVHKDNANPYPRNSQKLWFSCEKVVTLEEKANTASCIFTYSVGHFYSLLAVFYLFYSFIMPR